VTAASKSIEVTAGKLSGSLDEQFRTAIPGFPSEQAGAAFALRDALASLPSHVFVLDPEMKVSFANRTFGAQPLEQLEGGHIAQAFPQQVHPLLLTTLHRVLATGQLEGFAAQFAAANGQPRHFDIQVSPVRRDGKISALTLIATETTEQVMAERAIATQARMIESMLEGVAVVNEQGIIEITNPAFDRLFGYGRGELIGCAMAELTHGAFTQRGRPVKQSVDSLTLEFEVQRRDGSGFTAGGVLSRFEVAGRDHSLVVLQDVSERKQLERAILLAVNREQYRIGNDLHDGLGQELTGIALMLRGVAGRVTTEYPAILPEVEGITRLLSNTIENTRALARGLSPVNLERGGLQDALEGLAMNATDLYGVRVTFTRRLRGAKPLGAELANHLYRIAQEAVRNAVRHGQARTIRLHLAAARAKVSLAITDDGIGMSEQAMDATGMGLKIMRYRARMLGGEVLFERVEPTGTRVVCECPIEGDAPSPRAKSRRSRSKPKPSSG
jgi:PAS domain S-box-containing protein